MCEQVRALRLLVLMLMILSLFVMLALLYWGFVDALDHDESKSSAELMYGDDGLQANPSKHIRQ